MVQATMGLLGASPVFKACFAARKNRDNLHGSMNSEPGNSPEINCFGKHPDYEEREILSQKKKS